VNGIQGIGVPASEDLSSGESFASILDGSAAMSPAFAQLNAIAGSSDSQALKLSLANENISLTDHSDVGPGKRFETANDKLSYVMDRKIALLLEIRMAMISGGGWGPSNSEEIAKARGDQK